MKTNNTRRYYLHRRLKGVVKINAYKRVINLPVDFTPPNLLTKSYIDELVKMNYKIQLTLNL